MGARQGLPGSLAARVTYLLEPKNWLIVTIVGVGFHADGLAGAGWGLLAAFFAAVLPTVFISYGIRRGHWDDRNVGGRRPRLVGLLGWSRVAVRDHSWLQVAGGSVLGAAAALAFTAFLPAAAGPSPLVHLCAGLMGRLYLRSV